MSPGQGAARSDKTSVLRARLDLEKRANQPAVQRPEVNLGGRTQMLLFAVGTAVGVVVVAVCPDVDVQMRLGFGRPEGVCRTHRLRQGQRSAEGDDQRYSSQPHWIQRKGVSVSTGS